MTDLERFRAWLQTYPGAAAFTDWQIDYTDSLPGGFGIFPSGLQELSRKESICGDVWIQNQYNFALYLAFAKSPGDDIGAQVNAETVLDFQRWVQAQSATHQAPTFGTYDQHKETISAQNGMLLEADAGGTALYMIQLAAKFTDYYKE